jgi:HPt (histidine-containing phosphotransfer) domain-containing protein
MYYLHTKEKEIIAVSHHFLELLQINTLAELHTQMYSNTTRLSESGCGTELHLQSTHVDKCFQLKREKLTTLTENLFLVYLKEILPEVPSKNITIDTKMISQQIGISQNDYHHFLSDYISHAISLEPKLKSATKALRKKALSTLSQLSSTLHLYPLQPILDAISNATSYTKRIHAIEAFYASLIDLTTMTETTTKKRGTPSDIIPQKYNYTQVAAELSLSKELIRKLLKEFIVQLKKELPSIEHYISVENYRAIAHSVHSLKGTADNLRLSVISTILSKMRTIESQNGMITELKALQSYMKVLQKEM